MSFVITVAQRKGGAGKTTIACQLAAAFANDGRTVACIDLDPQASFCHWRSRRPDDAREIDMTGPQKASRFGVNTLLWGLRNIADIVIIDTPPSVGAKVETAIRAADIVLTPLQLSPLDLDASLPTAEMIAAARKPALFIVNRAPARARVADRIRAEIVNQELPVAATELGNRTAYSESIALGLGVVETAPTSKAADEVRALAAEIMARGGLAQAAE